MRLGNLFAGFLALLLYGLGAFACPPTNATSSHLVTRSYGVKIPQGGNRYSMWPFSYNDANGKVSPVRYCYDNVGTAKRWQGVMNDAMAKWYPATSNSALRFMLDPACKGITDCVCDWLTANGKFTDALAIIDEGLDKYPNLGTSPGYDRTYDGTRKNIHYIRISGHDPSNEAHYDELVTSIGHELGHAIGLMHEHQRPDRDAFVLFSCKNVRGYAEGKAAAKTAWDTNILNFSPECNDMDFDQCFDRVVCEQEQYANRYFPAAKNFIKGDHLSCWDQFAVMGTYDPSSIMHYSSFDGGSTDVAFPDGAVLAWKGPGGQFLPIWEGGHSDPKFAKPSDTDIQNVLRLYPR